MTPLQYCYQKAAPQGSALYYSIRQLPLIKRNAIVAIYALYVELNDVVFEYSDQGVAFAKINWWQLELSKLVDGKSDHPVVIALKKSVSDFKISPQRFLDMMNGVTQNFNLSPFAMFEDVTVHLIHTAGVRELLIADVVQEDSQLSSETIYQFMLVLELVQHIQHLHRYVKRGLVLFSEDEMRKFGVSLPMLQAYKTTDEIRQLLAYEAEKIKRAYVQATAATTPDIRRDYKYLIIRSEIAMAVLREIQASRFEVLENLIDVTPLRRWWLSL